MDALTLIREFLDSRLGIPPQLVTPAVALSDLGVDSLMMLELVFECEDRFGVTLDKNSKNPKTVGDLVALVDSLRSEQG